MVAIRTIDMKSYRNNYYQEKLKNAYSTKIHCDVCNKEVNLSSLKRHIKTSLHMKNLSCGECTGNTELIERILTRLTET